MIILFMLFFFIQLHAMEENGIYMLVNLKPQGELDGLETQFVAGKSYTLEHVANTVVNHKIKDIKFVSYILSLICWKQDQNGTLSALHYSKFDQINNFGTTQQTLARKELLRAQQTKRTLLSDLFKSYAIPTGCFLFGIYCHYLWAKQKVGTEA